MRRQHLHLPFSAVAAAIAIVRLVAFDVPIWNLFLLAVVLQCPLMMLFMMRGTHSGAAQPGRSAHEGPRQLPTRPTVARSTSAAR